MELCTLLATECKVQELSKIGWDGFGHFERTAEDMTAEKTWKKENGACIALNVLLQFVKRQDVKLLIDFGFGLITREGYLVTSHKIKWDN